MRNTPKNLVLSLHLRTFAPTTINKQSTTIIKNHSTMKKIYLALMCMASLSLMTACGDKKSDKGDVKDENKTEEVADNDEQDADEQNVDEQEFTEEADVWGDPAKAEPLDLTALYAAGDFKPAANVIFEDTLSKEAENAGELPTKWDIKEGSAEVGEANGHYYIKMLGGTTVLLPQAGGNDFLPSKYTIEFDFMFGYDVWYHVNFFTAEEGVGDYNMWRGHADWNFAKNDDEWIHGEQGEFYDYTSRDGWNHFAASYDNGNMKLFVNGKRIANLPNIKQATYFTITGDNADGKSHYIRTIRICK